jgi:coatomer subunit beta'
MLRCVKSTLGELWSSPRDLDNLDMASTLLSLSKDLSKRTANNLSLQLRETVVLGKMSPNTANSVYKIQRQLFARSERVKGIDFHPVEPWILTTLYSGMWIRNRGAWELRAVADSSVMKVMSTYGPTRLRYVPLFSLHLPSF